MFVANIFHIFFPTINFFHQMLQKPQKHEKHDFWDFESFEILDRDFWIFRFAIIFELDLKKWESYDFFETFFTYSEAYELSEKYMVYLWQNFSIYRKIDLKFSRFRIFGVLGVRLCIRIYHRTHAGADPRIEATVFCVKVFKMRLRRDN